MFLCSICNKSFDSKVKLRLHKKISKHYEDVLFTCLKCQYRSTVLNNLEKHSCIDYEHPIENYEELQHKLQIEIAKNKIYAEIISKNTNILLDELTLEKKEVLNLCEDSKVLINSKPIPDLNIEEKRGSSYRPVKHMKIVCERTEKEQQYFINKAKENKLKMLEQFSVPKDAYPVFEQDIETLKTSRMYTKVMEHIRNIRWSIIGNMLLSKYIELVYKHIELFKGIFLEKNYSEKKTRSIISSGLTAMEQRIISYEGYTETHLDVDDMQKFEISLTLNTIFPENYAPFKYVEFYEKFLNYGSVLFSLSDNIERYLINIYESYNVIYLPLPKSQTDDPFSFYILESVHRNRRKWKMDCRLEELSNGLISNLLPYLISKFRNIFHDVFHDNDYRKDYSQKCQITECDCEQITHTILMLSNPKQMRIKLREIVMKKCTYYPTENDKFNLYGDDSIQRQRLESGKDETDPVNVIRQLFDNITSEDAVDFYRNHS
jgi:hypothetical protein